ncbi:MAG: acetylxylan esterase [Solirubrobacterales bacterium]|nr:acetylxylan esterase [Solirubrobacterales bacterium]
MRKLVVVAVAVVSAMVFTSSAEAAIPKVFDGKGNINCTVQGAGQYAGQRWCGTGTSTPLTRSTAKTFDNVPIDVNVSFPAGGDGPYPLMMIFHGYALFKSDFANAETQRWLDRGYAVFSMADRGFHESCGSQTSRLAAGSACDEGYLRLMDTRYEVRDAQYLAGLLADEGRVVPNKIAATGPSYGGGLSMALAALKNRVMMPNDQLVPWKSPDGKSMEIAVAIPNIPWTDLAYSLVPNGNTLDYVEDNSYYGRFGVMKESWVNLLYSLGLVAGEGNYAPAGSDPSADLNGWKSLLDAGEPYDGRPEAQAILDDITRHHSSYYIDHSVAPAPLLISNGFTDDLFPVDEAIRFYNRTRAQYPESPIGLFLNPNSGHMRGMSKADVTAAKDELENKWVDYYLKDEGTKPAANVTAYEQTCPANVTAGEPHVAKDWASMAPGEIRVLGRAEQTVGKDSGNPVTGGLFNPAPTGMACTPATGEIENGSADYTLPPAPAGGYTVLGSPTVVAKITQPGNTSQIAARLVDVSPDGLQKILIARAVWRPTSGRQVFQLHANAYKVAEGHVARLELLAKDASVPAGGVLNYVRPSNGQTDAKIQDLELRVPVAEKPGSVDGLVKAPEAKVLPDEQGVALAPGYEKIGAVPVKGALKRLRVVGKIKAKGRKLKLRVLCPKSARRCPGTGLKVRKGKRTIGHGRGFRVGKGLAKTIKLKLNRRGRRLLRGNGRNLKRFRARVRIKSGNLERRTVGRTLKRTGRVR